MRLKIFCVCEKVILAADSNQVSLINLFSEVNVTLNEQNPMPAEPVIPFNWSVFALWRKESDAERDLQYRQRIRLVDPNGRPTLTQEASFSFGANSEQRFVATVFGLGGVAGVYRIAIDLFDDEHDHWAEVASDTFTVSHVAPARAVAPA